jgi:DNA-binding NtrC family response regulator
MSTESPSRQGLQGASARLLVVEDDAEMRALLTDILTDQGYEVTPAANGAEALIRLRSQGYAGIILDKNMPGLSGLDILPGLRTACPETPVIMITAFGDVPSYVDAIERGAFAYLFKPFMMRELLDALDQALGSRNARVPTARLRGEAQ